MKVRDALVERKSVRAFLDKPVERVLIESLLDAARHAPSGANTQPWQVAVVTGEKKKEIQQAMEGSLRGQVLFRGFSCCESMILLALLSYVKQGEMLMREISAKQDLPRDLWSLGLKGSSLDE